MHGKLLLRLIERWETPAAVLRAPSAALRELGLPPGLVAAIVAAPRQRAATTAALKSLERMRILPVSLLDPSYPHHLRGTPAPPLMLYVQGAWPPTTPMVALVLRTELDAEQRQPAAELLATLARLGVTVMAGYGGIELLPAAGSAAVLPFGLLLARNRVPETLRAAAAADQATLISVAPVNAPPTPAVEATTEQVLVASADGLIVAGDTLPAGVDARPELHLWALPSGNAAADPRATRRARGGEAGARAIAHGLGIRPVGGITVQQERLL